MATSARGVLVLLHVAGAAATCLRGQAYGTSTQRGAPFSTNVKDAEACQASCLSSNNCKYFTYDTGTTDCWLLEQVLFLQMKDDAISGVVDCKLEEDDEASRKERIMGALKAASQLVHDRTSSDKTREDAKHVLWSIENGFLSEERYSKVSNVLSDLSTLIDSPEGLIEVAQHGAMLTADDVRWLTRHMSNEEVPENHPHEEAEPDASAGGAVGSACSGGSVACDEGGLSLGAGTPWKDAKVKYCFDVQLMPSSKQAVECAMAKIQSHVPGIVFENVQYAGTDRCATSPAIYVQSNGRRSGNGCWADIGMSSSLFGGNQKLNLQAPGCDNCGTATHELLHALGMAHEQSRADRDKYITILWSNIRQGMDGQFTKNPKADTLRPYDIMSIMHYSSRSFSKNGGDTILVKPEGYALYTTNPQQFTYYRVGQRLGMSRNDVSQLQELYGCQEGVQCHPASGGGDFIDILNPSSFLSDYGIVIIIVVILAVVVCVGAFCFCVGGSRSSSYIRYERFP